MHREYTRAFGRATEETTEGTDKKGTTNTLNVHQI